MKKNTPTSKPTKPSYFSFDYPFGKELHEMIKTAKVGAKTIYGIGISITLGILAVEAASMVFTPLYAISLGIKLLSLVLSLGVNAVIVFHQGVREATINDRNTNKEKLNFANVLAFWVTPGALLVPYLMATHPVTAFSMAAYISLTAAIMAFLTHDLLKGNESIIGSNADSYLNKIDEWMNPSPARL